MEITTTKSMPKKILVLIIANMSSPFEIFAAKIWVVMKIDTTKINIISTEKYPMEVVIMKNQKDRPAVTASDLNLGEDASISNWIYECH